MIYRCFIFYSLFIYAHTYAQAPVTFSKTYDIDETAEVLSSVYQAVDAYYVAGVGWYNEAFDLHPIIEIMKINPTGEALWKQMYGFIDADLYTASSYNLLLTQQGTLLCFGQIHTDTGGVNLVFLEVDTADGGLLRLQHFSKPGDQVPGMIYQLESGNFLASYFDYGMAGGSGTKFMKTDYYGNILMDTLYGGGSEWWSGGFVVSAEETITMAVGYELCPGNFWRRREIDSAGHLLRNELIYNGCMVHMEAAQNGFYTYSQWGEPLEYSTSMFKLDTACNIIFQDTTLLDLDTAHFTGGQISFTSTVALDDGSSVVDGYFWSAWPGDYNIFIHKVNAAGEELWNRIYTCHPEFDFSITYAPLLHTADNGFLIAGFGISEHASDIYNQDFWLLKLDSVGCLVPGCDSLDDQIFEIPDQSTAIHVFPNPIVSEAIILVQLPDGLRGEISWVLSDLSGQQVAQHSTFTQLQQTGSVSIGFTRDQLPGGIYFMTIYADQMVMGTTRIILL